ncbi:twin-arginine translocation signal domain-containing protein, partial [Pseudomonas sp. SIMBA_021]
MTISRRGFIAGVALTGVVVPGALGALYVQRQRDAEAFPQTPGEAVVELADTALQQLGDTLRGIWRWTLQGKDAGL